MNGASRWSRALRTCEERLRARGLTGSEAFDALLPALEVVAGGAGPADRALLDELAQAEPPRREDVLGLAYERFFPEVYKGGLGQYFTPPALARVVWSRLRAGPQDVVLDPTCGSGGLLAPAVDTGAELRGIEVDPRLARLATLQLRLLGAEPRVRRADVFTEPPEPVEVVVSNPPFSVVLDDPEVVAAHRDLAGPRGVTSDHVLLAGLHRWVRPGGTAAVIVPWSVLANRSGAAVRERLRGAFEVEAVLALPEGVFRPFGGAAGRAAVVWLRRRERAGKGLRPWFRTLSDPGWDVRSRHLRFTSDAEVEAVVRGDGFVRSPAGRFLPAPAPTPGRPVHDLASVVTERGRMTTVADLGDVDPQSGDLRPRVAVPARRVPVIRPGDVAFSRLRPELGVVAVHAGPEPVSGSAEWLVLRPHAWPRWLRHALRTPTFARSLPTTGQTRPRAPAEAVLTAPVPTPPDDVCALVDRASARLAEQHRRAAEGLRALQEAVDAHAAGQLDAPGLRAVALRLLDGGIAAEHASATQERG